MATVDPTEVQAIENGFTKGWSPKTILAILFPLLTGLAGFAVDWIVSGKFDVTAVRVLVATFVLSAVSGIGAWLGKPGKVVGPPVALNVGTANDELLAQHLDKQ